MPLSKSTKRRKCLEECEELGLAIESSDINEDHFNVINQPGTSYEHTSDLEISNNNVENINYSINLNTENYDSDAIDQNLIENYQKDNILVPTFSSDSDSSNDGSGEKLLMSIKYWAVEHKISNLALSNLLKMLKINHDCFHHFPSDAQTLLKTSVSNKPLQIQTMSPGIFYYFGLANGLKATIGKNIFSDDIIILHLGIDGLPLTKSTNSQFWPILCCIRNLTLQRVFLVGLYWGTEKPTDSNIYLLDLVNELKELCTHGIDLPLGRKQIKIEAISCDAPAKSFVLKTKGHSGFSSCSRCKTVGVFSERRVCFPDISFNKRTHTEFLNRADEDYQTSESISVLSEIPDLDMVNSLPFDYMHLVCLGVVKKNILLWLGSIKNSPLSVRIPSRSVKLISTRLLHLKINFTCDFSRIPRSLNEVLRWKATEFRSFILYTGPVVLQSIISKECYDHFICLHVSITVLLSPAYKHLLHFINTLLIYYVQKFGEIYGEEFLSHNIHGLLHLCDDYSKFGPLDNCSCFPYENFMQTLKKMVRSNAKPLHQVIKRYKEFTLFGKLATNDNQNTEDFFKHLHFDGPLSDGCTSPQYKIVCKTNFMIKIRSTSDCFIGFHDDNKRNVIIKVENICYHPQSSKNVFLGRLFNKIEPFYTKPINSLKLGIAIVSNLSNSYSTCNIDMTNLKKYMVLHTNDKINYTIAFPILHSSNN